MRVLRHDFFFKQKTAYEISEGKGRLAFHERDGCGRTPSRSARRGERPEDRPTRAAEGATRAIAKALRILGRGCGANRARSHGAQDGGVERKLPKLHTRVRF